MSALQGVAQLWAALTAGGAVLLALVVGVQGGVRRLRARRRSPSR
jgi:hypothetical protein